MSSRNSINKIEFEIGTITRVHNSRIKLATTFTVHLMLGGELFIAQEEFDTEDKANTYIDGLKSVLKPKPKKTKELPNVTS